MIRKRDKPTAICPFLRSLGRESPAPVSRPDYLHRCTANDQRREVTPQTQVVFCLTDQHRTCPFFTAAMPEAAAAAAREEAG